MAICCRNISEEEMHKRFFNLAVDASSVYPWQYDIRTHSFHFSGALLDYFGLPGKQTILRKELELFIHSDDLEEAHRHFTAIFKGEEMDTRMSFRMRSEKVNMNGGNSVVLLTTAWIPRHLIWYWVFVKVSSVIRLPKKS